MPYVQRDGSGAIVGVFEQQQSFASEWLDPSAPELAAFVARQQVPAAISSVQGRLVLLGQPATSGSGTMLDQVNALVQASSDVGLKVWWGSPGYGPGAATWEREHPRVLAMAQALGLTSAQVDGLFVATGSVS